MKIKIKFSITRDEKQPVNTGDRYPSLYFDDTYEQAIEVDTQDKANEIQKNVIVAFNGFGHSDV